MARIFTWPTKSIVDLADLIPIGDDATGLDKATSFANFINSLQLEDWIINKSASDAILKWYKGNNGVDQKDVRLELTSTGLQLNLYDDSGVFISTVWEQVYSTGTLNYSPVPTVDTEVANRLYVRKKYALIGAAKTATRSSIAGYTDTSMTAYSLYEVRISQLTVSSGAPSSGTSYARILLPAGGTYYYMYTEIFANGLSSTESNKTWTSAAGGSAIYQSAGTQDNPESGSVICTYVKVA